MTNPKRSATNEASLPPDLAFTAEDINSFHVFHVDGDNGKTLSIRGEPELLEVLNGILAEKLAKAPEVYGPSEGYVGRWSEISGPHSTHSARLVCIEELKKYE